MPAIAVATLCLCLLPMSTSMLTDDDPTPDALIAAHNRERAERKLPPVKAEAKLTVAARLHAADMAKRKVMSHDGGDGSTPADRVKRQKYVYQAIGENVAYGQKTVDAVMDAWMNSPDHREHVLGDFDEVGVAVAVADDGTPYWCVDFGRTYPKLDQARAEAELAERINHARTDRDKKPLTVSKPLGKAARRIAQDMAADLAPDLGARLKESGYRYLSVVEGGMTGSPTAEATLKAMLDSEDQKKNLLGPFTDLGVGFCLTPEGRPAWCVILARPAPGGR